MYFILHFSHVSLYNAAVSRRATLVQTIQNKYTKNTQRKRTFKQEVDIKMRIRQTCFRGAVDPTDKVGHLIGEAEQTQKLCVRL